MKHGGTPGAYGGMHGCGKHGCPFQYDGWFGGQTVIGSAAATPVPGSTATAANVVAASTVRSAAAGAETNLNNVVDVIPGDDSG